MARSMKKILTFIVIFLVASLVGPAAVLLSGDLELKRHWRDAAGGSSHQAPDPAVTREAVVQVYAARAYNWRGAFGVHPWIAVKPGGAREYTVYEVIGWRVRHGGGNAIGITNRPPDGHWYGNTPELLLDIRGTQAEAAIPKIRKAVKDYPYKCVYRVWPGPNSNTFVAHVARQVPELALDLPATAVGKDFIPGGVFAATPSGTGWQVSLYGLVGVLAGVEEGVEVSLLAMTFGIDPGDLSLKMPGWGRIRLRAKTAAPPATLAKAAPAAPPAAKSTAQ